MFSWCQSNAIGPNHILCHLYTEKLTNEWIFYIISLCWWMNVLWHALLWQMVACKTHISVWMYFDDYFNACWCMRYEQLFVFCIPITHTIPKFIWYSLEKLYFNCLLGSNWYGNDNVYWCDDLTHKIDQLDKGHFITNIE